MKLRLVAAALLCSTAALAGGVAAKKAQRENEERLKGDVDSLNQKCGSKIVLAMDMSKFKSEDWTGYNPPCGLGLEGVGQVCAKGPEYKEAVAKTIKTFKCTPISGTKGSVSVKGGEVTYLAVANGDVASPDATAAAVEKEVDK